MTPQQFIEKWSDSRLKESAGAQEHFIDLCRMLDEKTPAGADPDGDWYAFEKGALKTGGGDGWADVWKRGCFAWEYKSKGKDLSAALRQLKMYAGSLHNPPLLIVSDMETIEIHTNWTNMVQEVHVLTFKDLLDARRRQILKKAFSETAVEELRPGRKRSDLTRDVAQEFVFLAQNLRDRGHDAEKVAHFVNRLVFCMFAEDVDLLPGKLFKRMLAASADDPDSFVDNAKKLFKAMAEPNGRLDFTRIEWFNGGLFNDDNALPLTKADIKVALKAANQDWSNIDPSIMGTLLERGTDPSKRSQLGMHYTDPEKIMMIVDPVVVEPLLREWDIQKAKIVEDIDKSRTAKSAGARTAAFNRAQEHKTGFIERLRAFRILDPACGSGNFLYLGLKALKDIEHRVNTECETLGLARGFPVVGPENVLGIEINSFATELARVSVWIGEIQWMREHGFDASRNPILKPLDTIKHHDALLNEDGSEYEWPAADAIVGNPPFLGGKLLRTGLGDETVERMFETFEGRVPAEADLVCYWFAKTRDLLESRFVARAGLVATNSIRGGANRVALEAILDGGRIFEAWSDEPWILDGAAVRVSLVCFDGGNGNGERRLDGNKVVRINADLTATADDLTKATRLAENAGVAFMGDTKGGAFDVPGELARGWLRLPLNPNGRPNSEVLRPWANAADVTRRSRDEWIIDFGWTMSETEATLFEAPFARILENVKQIRVANKREMYARLWWRHVEPRPTLRNHLGSLPRYLATPRVAKHRNFVWLHGAIVPDSRLFAFVRDDDFFFGLLTSRQHEIWALATCSWHGVGNDPTYNATTCFETFPFPEGLTPDIPAADYATDPRVIAVATAARRLNELRENWLNPADLVQRVPEAVPGFPDRLLSVDETAAAILKERTLTKLYNARPAWLDHAHRDLDAAVASAYGWSDWNADQPLADAVILERLFKLNQERAAQERLAEAQVAKDKADQKLAARLKS